MFGLFADRYERQAAVEFYKRVKAAKNGETFTVISNGSRIVLSVTVQPMTQSPIEPLGGVEAAVSTKTTVIVEQDPTALNLDQPPLVPNEPKP